MDKVRYKVLDERGRITIPRDYRNDIGLNAGDVIRLVLDEEKCRIVISKADVMEYEKEDPEMLEACIYAAVRTLTREKKVALAASLLSPMVGR